VVHITVELPGRSTTFKAGDRASQQVYPSIGVTRDMLSDQAVFSKIKAFLF